MRIEGDQNGHFEKNLVKSLNGIWGSADIAGNTRTWKSTKSVAAVLKLRKELAPSVGPRPPRFHITINAPKAPLNPKP